MPLNLPLLGPSKCNTFKYYGFRYVLTTILGTGPLLSVLHIKLGVFAASRAGGRHRLLLGRAPGGGELIPEVGERPRDAGRVGY